VKRPELALLRNARLLPTRREVVAALAGAATINYTSSPKVPVMTFTRLFSQLVNDKRPNLFSLTTTRTTIHSRTLSRE
jgi:hypothetical protein